ncbi:MAG: hypothetical protein JNJ64_07915 [Flavobacteriales bacterium]|nr:hypothetical protein [Flavobacteriales bacterium]
MKISEAQQLLMEKQQSMMFELERGRLHLLEAHAKQDKCFTFAYKNVGSSTIEFLGVAYWDLGPWGKEVEKPQHGELGSVRMHRLLPAGESIDVQEIPWLHGITTINQPREGGVRIGVRVYYRSLGHLRVHQHGLVFTPSGGRQTTYTAERYVAADFERDESTSDKEVQAIGLVRIKVSGTH